MRTILLTDAVVDLCVLLAAQISVGSFRPARLCVGWLALACGNLLFSVEGLPNGARSVVPFCACAAAAAVLAARGNPAAILETALCVFLASLSAAGFALIGGAALPWAPAGCAFAAGMLRIRRHIRARWNIEVVLEAGGRRAVFAALIDTGNRLRDRKRGLPVLIAEEAVLTEILSVLPKNAIRSIPYSVLGSGGQIECFLPDALSYRFIGEAPREAPPCVVGVFPGTIPGIACALAPPEFADVPHLLPEIMQRRVHHAVFKR